MKELKNQIITAIGLIITAGAALINKNRRKKKEK